MADNIDWIVVSDDFRKIGAIGFIGDKAAIIAAFYDYRDTNYDGQLSLREKAAGLLFGRLFDLKNQPTVSVAMAARLDIDVVSRDPTFPALAAHIFTNFATGLVMDGYFTVYLSRAVGQAAGEVAGAITTNPIKQYVIRKGLEKSVKAIYDASMKGGGS